MRKKKYWMLIAATGAMLPSALTVALVASAIISQIGTTHYFPYDMENSYLAYIFDIGIIGFLLFLT